MNVTEKITLESLTDTFEDKIHLYKLITEF